MKKIFVLLLNIMLVVVTYGQTESDATTIAQINIELYRIESKADSIQINGIIDMLVSEKKKLDNGSRDYIKKKEDIKLYKIKYEYLINTVNQRYADDVGFHISDVVSYDEVNNLRKLIASCRRRLILNKYKQMTYDYIDSKN